MPVVECNNVTGSRRDRQFQNHVILRIRKDATPKIVYGLLLGNLRNSIDHIVNGVRRDEYPTLRPVADIIVFREQRNR